jgi:hypothetical protein
MNPGDYYESKAREAQRIREQLKTETDPKRIKALKAQLEMAECVGD